MTAETSASDAYDGRRRRVLERLGDRRHELAQKLVEEYRAVIPEYRELPEAVLVRDVAEVAVQNIQHLALTFKDGFEHVGEGHEWLRRSAARRVHQHVSLPSLLRTFRLWENHLWRAVAEMAGEDSIGRQLAVDAADAMMRCVDQVSTEVTQAYVLESSAVATDGQALRADVLETMLTGEPVSERARRQVAVVGSTLRDRLLVMVIKLPPRDDRPPERRPPCGPRGTSSDRWPGRSWSVPEVRKWSASVRWTPATTVVSSERPRTRSSPRGEGGSSASGARARGSMACVSRTWKPGRPRTWAP